jgi:predicted phosphodiesterase
VTPSLTRILSDLHYGEHACRLRHLSGLEPLLKGVGHLILNGDSVDTRPGPHPARTAGWRAELGQFLGQVGAMTTVLTGNHDADLSTRHHLVLAEGRVFVTHGDLCFPDIVPWSQDAPAIRRRITAELARHPVPAAGELDHLLGVFRRVAGEVPQRHHAEPHRGKYAVRYLVDTVWPPARLFRVLHTWQQAPDLAFALGQRHLPGARLIVCGHTHRPGIWRHPDGRVHVNTGSFCPPLGALCVDLVSNVARIRRVKFRRGEAHPGRCLAEIPLAPSARSEEMEP